MLMTPGDHTTFAAASAAPMGNVGVALATAFPSHAMRPRRWLLTLVVSGGASNATLWGARPEGVAADSTDDIWGVVQDRFKQFPLGVIGTALPVGTYHYIIDDIGIFSRLYVQNSANAINVTLTEILESTKGS